MNIKTSLTLLLVTCFLAFGCRHERSNKILVLFRGDSFCSGIGSSGTTPSATFSTGKQVQGPNTWGKQLQCRLDSISKGKYVVDMLGYPGQTSEWYLRSAEFKEEQEKVKQAMGDYVMVIFCPEFGTNDEVMPGIDKPGYPDTLANNIRAINNLMRTAAADDVHFKIIAYPLTNRGDKYAKSNTNAFRNQYNAMIGPDPKWLVADVVLNYKKYPQMFSNDAYKGKFFNQNDVDNLSGVHPNDAGYGVLAKMSAEAIIQVSKEFKH